MLSLVKIYRDKIITLLIVLLLLALIISQTQNYFYKKKMKYYANESIRWRDNYTSFGIKYDSLRDVDSNFMVRMVQKEFTSNELLASKDKKIIEIQRQLKLSEIQIQKVDNILSFQITQKDKIIWNLQSILDSVSINSHYVLTDTMREEIETEFSIINLELTPNFEFFVDHSVRIPMYGFLYIDQVLVRERKTRFGKWWVDTKLGFLLSKKREVSKAELKTTNKKAVIEGFENIQIIHKNGNK